MKDKYKCPRRNCCPHLNFESASKVRAERDYLRGEVDRMNILMERAAQEIMAKDREISERDKKIAKLEEKVTSLQEEIKQIHQEPFKKRKKEEDNPPVKNRGAPEGHKGGGRKRPLKVNYIVDVYAEKCKDCGSTNIRLYRNTKPSHHTQEDIVLKVEKITTLYRKYWYRCQDCGKVFLPPPASGEIPNARIGPNARAIETILKYKLKLPYDKVEGIFCELFGFPLTSTTLVGFDNKTKDQAKPVFELLQRELKYSNLVYGDETGWPVDGANWWLWCLANESIVCFLIDKSRGSKVIKGVLGEDFDGILSSDFYSAYNCLLQAIQQKCNTHLLRKMREIRTREILTAKEQRFLEELKELVQEGMQGWGKYHQKQLDKASLCLLKKQILKKIKVLIAQKFSNKEVETLKGRIQKRKSQIFTYLEHPEIEPTNNRVERLLRGPVIWRKICFGNRSTGGTENVSIILSLIQTAEINEVNPLFFFSRLLWNQPPKTLFHHLLGRTLPPIRGP